MHAGALDDGSRQFDLPRRVRRQHRAFALGAFGVAVLLALVMTIEGGRDPDPVLLAISAVLLAIFTGIGLWSLRISRSQRYGIELGRDGLRPLTGGTADWVSWAEIAELRERPLLERVELCTPGGEVRARLEYQLEGFERVLAAVVARARPAPHLETRGSVLEARNPSTRTPVAAAVVVASVALAFLSYRHLGGALPLILPGLLLVGAIADHFLCIRSVEVRDSQLRVHALVGRPAVDLDVVDEVRLGLRDLTHGRKRLDVLLVFSNGEEHFVRPPGVDAFALYRLIAASLPETRRSGKAAPGA